jgi:hypothetical protein
LSCIPTTDKPEGTAADWTIKGLWLTREEILALPTSGSGWANVKAAADGSLGTPQLAVENMDHDVRTPAAVPGAG